MKYTKKVISLLMVIFMIFTLTNITAYSAEVTPFVLNFSTGASGDRLPQGEGSAYYTTEGPENQCYAVYEALDGTICAAVTDKSTTESTALHIPFEAVNSGVVTVETTVGSTALGVDLCRILSSEGAEVSKLRLLPTGYLALITDGDNFSPVPLGTTLPVNKLKTFKFTFDFSAKTVTLSADGFTAETAFSASDIKELVFETTKASYRTKIYVSEASLYEGDEKKNDIDVSLPTLFLIGDSTGSPYTVSDYYKNGGNYLVMRNGFGMAFDNYFNTDKINLVNYAVSGISSKSFTSNANYASLTSSWKAGDYLIIAFGHNDEKDSDEARFSNASMGAEGIDTEGQFANSLYVNYIKPAQEAGVNVILATPIIRRSRTLDVVTGSDIHDLTEKGFGDYSQTIRDLAEKLDLPCIDNTQMTYNEYITLGKGSVDGSDGYGAYQAAFSDDYMNTKEYFTESGELDENYRLDNTHLNSYGAKTVAYFMAEAVSGSSEILSGEEYTPVASDNSEGVLESLASYLKSYKDPRTEGKTEDVIQGSEAEGFSIYLDTETTLHDTLGETFDVTVNIKDNPGLSSLNFSIDYDSDILKLVSPDVPNADGSVFTESVADADSEYADGVVAVYTFEVVGGGDTDLTLNVKYADHNDTVYVANTDFSVGSLSIVCDFNPEQG
ncbi:MAG: hypothetical protein LUC97_08070 [Clostridiales bacterium]|nr:hypothetical protein [Clostridiales bacterium]